MAAYGINKVSDLSVESQRILEAITRPLLARQRMQKKAEALCAWYTAFFKVGDYVHFSKLEIRNVIATSLVWVGDPSTRMFSTRLVSVSGGNGIEVTKPWYPDRVNNTDDLKWLVTHQCLFALASCITVPRLCVAVKMLPRAMLRVLKSFLVKDTYFK